MTARLWRNATPEAGAIHTINRGAGPSGKSDPRDHRQLCDPQASEGVSLCEKRPAGFFIWDLQSGGATVEVTYGWCVLFFAEGSSS